MGAYFVTLFRRDTGRPKRGYGAVLPRHNPDYNKAHYETTHLADYKAPFEFTPAEVIFLFQ